GVEAVAAYSVVVARGVLHSGRMRAGEIDHVELTGDRPQVAHLANADAPLSEVLADLVAHAQQARTDECQLNVSEPRQQVGQRVRRSLVGQVTDEGDTQAIDLTELAPQRVDVQQRLRRMFALTITSVDDRHARHGRGASSATLLVVAEEDEVVRI